MTPAARKPKKSAYTAETKAAVMAALLQGQGTQQVAKEYNLPEGTVKTWRQRMKASDGSFKDSTVEPEKREEIGDLLIGYLRANLATLRKQLDQFGNPDWIRGQTAADMAVLHGVMTDKSIRLLEALGGVHESAAS